jgi:hypothetical protein
MRFHSDANEGSRTVQLFLGGGTCKESIACIGDGASLGWGVPPTWLLQGCMACEDCSLSPNMARGKGSLVAAKQSAASALRGWRVQLFSKAGPDAVGHNAGTGPGSGGPAHGPYTTALGRATPNLARLSAALTGMQHCCCSCCCSCMLVSLRKASRPRLIQPPPAHPPTQSHTPTHPYTYLR